MTLDQSTLLGGYAAGTVGVVAYVVTIVLQVSPASGAAVALAGTLPIAALATGYPVYAGDSTIEDALVGASFGGVVFGVAVGLMNMSRVGPSFVAVVSLALFTVSVPVAGVVGGVVGDYLGAGDGSDEATPA